MEHLLAHATRFPLPPGGLLPGDAIDNAPRPLHGRVTWTGPFLHGIHYAAGPPATHDAPNAALDADSVVLVDDAEILCRLDQRLAQDGYTRADLTGEFGMTLREAVRACGLPELAVNHEDAVPPPP
jgi:hypothetical protein